MIISWFLGLVKRIGKTENQLKKIIGGKTCQVLWHLVLS